jgi:DNA transposition AAA+ family ATPase
MNIDLSHLDSAVRQLASATSHDRILMNSKDLFIEHEYSKHLTDTLDALLCEPRHGRMPCWLITGDAGMGKTAHLHRFARRYADHRSEDNAAQIRPIVIANMPPEPTRQTLEWAVLEALNAPTVLNGRGIDRAGVIRRLLAAHETRVLILDEAQHLCHSRGRDRAVVLDTIKAFSTTSQINVICAGTPAVEREFRSDPQIERRFSVTRFTPWTVGPALQRFVGTYERARPLRLPSRLSQPEMIRALISETGGITHRIMQCLNSAAVVAVHEGIERITAELLKVERSEPGRLLTARRQLSEESRGAAMQRINKPAAQSESSATV